MLDIEVVFPEKSISNKELALIDPNYNFDRLAKKIGIDERRVCGENETALDLAEKACEALLKRYDKANVDFIIYCTQSPEYFLPTTACILQNRLGLRTNIGAFDYNLGCSGYVYGLAMSKGLIKSKIAKNVLLVTAESYSKFLDEKDITNRAIFGDAATASMITAEVAEGLMEFNFGTDGSGAEHLMVKGGGAKSNFCFNNSKEDKLNMNGSEVFQFTLDKVPESIFNCLQKNEMTIEQIDYFILHQANKYMVNSLRKKINGDKDKFYNDVLKTGNTVSNTIPIALKKSIIEGWVNKEDYVFLSGFGVGLSWANTILKF